MRQIDLNTWDELEKEVHKLHEFLKSKRHPECYGTISKPLFRGQRSASWNLSTTLERYINHNISVTQYNHYLWRIKPAIEAYTGNNWNIETEINFDDKFIPIPSNSEFMAYVRHHGFPSPLLDWSESLYIASFFAFQKASIKENVAIYAYVEKLGDGKCVEVGAPQIWGLDPYVSTHKRHFMQQGQYTVSVEKSYEEWVYCSHEKYFSAATDESQDYLIKYTLPGDIKIQILEKLQSMNINSFTLFGNEDSLMDMLAFKEIFKKTI